MNPFLMVPHTQAIRWRILLFSVVATTFFLLSSSGVNGLVGISGSLSSSRELENIQCVLQVSVGRIPGTAMPPEWAASGAKLGFPLEIEFTDEPCADYDMTKERLLMGSPTDSKTIGQKKGGKFNAVVPLGDEYPTFISSKGVETIEVEEGAYSCQLQSIEAQQYTLRFFLDFPKGAIRNDVELPAERVYFMTSCWIMDENESPLKRAQKRYTDATQALEETNQQLQQLDQESNVLKKAMAIRESVLLVEKKQKLETLLYELEQTYPLQSNLIVRGPNNILFVKEGVIAVKRYRGAMETREQYHWIGQFTFQDFYDDDDDDDDEEE